MKQHAKARKFKSQIHEHVYKDGFCVVCDLSQPICEFPYCYEPVYSDNKCRKHYHMMQEAKAVKQQEMKQRFTLMMRTE